MNVRPTLIAAALALYGGSALAASQGSCQLSRADQNFLQKDAQGSLYEQDISQLASERATNPQIQQYANMVTQDHAQYQAALDNLAQNCGVALPASPDAAQQSRLSHLRSLKGASFDGAYVQDAKSINAEDIEQAQNEENRTQSDQVKNLINQFRPVDQKHEQQANNLPGSTNG